MVFSSYVFICVFLPIVLIGYHLLSKVKNGVFQKMFLIAASLFFYGYYNVWYLFIIVASIAVNYIVASIINKSVASSNKKRTFLVLGIVFNVGLIGYFKYFDFFIESINQIFGTDFFIHNILLPLGISFFTFQQLSFLISVYKCEETVGNLIDYIVFVTFFPQLVAGPIVLYSEMISQFKDKSRRYFNLDNFRKGIYFFSVGLFKKAVVADSLAIFVDNGFGMSDMGLVAAWATSLSYTLQIYFDFSGYSDMAMGLGYMFNIELPFNFLSPYKSRSIGEFWRKWHMTLGRALSTYIYRPMGGNRKGLPRTCLNLMITFLVSGLWHGAGWTFIAWGALHGLFIVIERIVGEQRLERIPKFIRIAVTFLIVNGLWVLFRADTFEKAIDVWKGMVNFRTIGLNQLADIAFDSLINFPSVVDYIYVIGLIVLLLVIVFIAKNSAERMKNILSKKRGAVLCAILLIVSLIAVGRNSVFIYFNF